MNAHLSSDRAGKRGKAPTSLEQRTQGAQCIDRTWKPPQPDLHLHGVVVSPLAEVAKPRQTFISVGLKCACSAVLMNAGSCPHGQEVVQRPSGMLETAKKPNFQVSVVSWLKTNRPLERSTHLPVLLAWNRQHSVVRKWPCQIQTLSGEEQLKTENLLWKTSSRRKAHTAITRMWGKKGCSHEETPRWASLEIKWTTRKSVCEGMIWYSTKTVR